VLAINEVRPDAAKAVTAFSDKGYKIIYLSARKLPFQSGLPKWFQENNFPEGALHVPQSVEESNDSETYKAGILNDYVHLGWQLEYAYGDSTTDFSAYSAAGIPKKRIFALKRRGKENCLEGIFEQCLNGWTEHLPYINNEVVVND
jgi:phosphatidate phosphatase PAH1